MTLPTIHGNGTGAKDLFNGYMAAREKLTDAVKAFNAIEFNARDYYVQNDGAWSKARAEQTERLKKLHAVNEDLFAIIVHIHDNARPGALD